MPLVFCLEKVSSNFQICVWNSWLGWKTNEEGYDFPLAIAGCTPCTELFVFYEATLTVPKCFITFKWFITKLYEQKLVHLTSPYSSSHLLRLERYPAVISRQDPFVGEDVDQVWSYSTWTSFEARRQIVEFGHFFSVLENIGIKLWGRKYWHKTVRRTSWCRQL